MLGANLVKVFEKKKLPSFWLNSNLRLNCKKMKCHYEVLGVEKGENEWTDVVDELVIVIKQLLFLRL